MHDERLIELVRQNPALYDFENSKYSDNHYKENIWKAIAKELNIPGSTCKSRWIQLRDQWRKNKRKNAIVSQTGKQRKKWRYDHEMSFLVPFIRLRDANFNESDNEEMNEDNTTVSGENMFSSYMTEESQPHKLSFPVSTKQEPERDEDEIAATVLIKYLAQMKDGAAARPKDPTDLFFESIAEKVKRFPPYCRNVVESKIFSLVQEMERQQILQQEQQQNTEHSGHHQS